MIMSLIRRVLPQQVRTSIKRAFGLPTTHLNSDWSILHCIGPVADTHVVLDLGAHHGWFFHCWQDWCPAARIHAFEPFPESFEAMARAYGNDPRVQLNQLGVGDAVGCLSLNVLSESLVSNSFLDPRDETWRRVGYATGAVSRVSVPVTTVDAYVREQGLEQIYLAKIDVQGFEMRVLRGAEQSLPRIDHIFVEAAIFPLYEGAPSFADVFEFLTARGFHLMTMRAWHRGNHALVETDMLFRRNDLAPPGDEQNERYYLEFR